MEQNKFDDIAVEQRDGITFFISKTRKSHRRVFYLNSYGMANAWRLINAGEYPSQHLWGCLELARRGYEVAMPEEPDKDSYFFNYRRQDWNHLKFIRSWLGKKGVVYSAHTILFWTPLLAALGLLKCPVVTLFYAKDENPRFSRGYSAIIAMTPSARERAIELSPDARIERLGWGVDLPFYPLLPYKPEWFLSCGRSRRDYESLSFAAKDCGDPVRLINTEFPTDIKWPANVKLYMGKKDGDWKTVSYNQLFFEHYAGCIASLITVQPDINERFASGFTQLLEAMALGRPVIVTRTGALPRELDVEKEGCGLFVPPNDPIALAKAMKTIRDNPERAQAMGKAGREVCERCYNMRDFGENLHQLFECI